METNISYTPQPSRGRGRPRKYATLEEAHQARLAQNREYSKTEKNKIYQKEYQKNYHSRKVVENEQKDREMQRLREELSRFKFQQTQQPQVVPMPSITLESGNCSPPPIITYPVPVVTYSPPPKVTHMQAFHYNNLPYIPGGLV